ncbi:MAG: hypothetical protein ACLQU1_09560 [Bryobacteraceae bacterium]
MYKRCSVWLLFLLPVNAQPGIVRGKVEWWNGRRQPVWLGEARIEGHGSVLVNFNGEFAFDFGAFKLKPGFPIRVSFKELYKGDLNVVIPYGGQTYAPDPSEFWTWKVAEANEKFAENGVILNELLAGATLHQKTFEVADSCGPNWKALSMVAQQTGTKPNLEDFEAALSRMGYAPDPPEPRSPVSDARCRAWRTQQFAALNQKLQTNTKVLTWVQDDSDSEALAPIYIDTADTRTRLAAIDMKEGHYDAAKETLEKAIADLKHAPGATDKRAEVQTLYDTAKRQGILKQ